MALGCAEAQTDARQLAYSLLLNDGAQPSDARSRKAVVIALDHSKHAATDEQLAAANALAAAAYDDTLMQHDANTPEAVAALFAVQISSNSPHLAALLYAHNDAETRQLFFDMCEGRAPWQRAKEATMQFA